MSSMKIEVSETARKGIELCKSGHWDEGLVCLNQAMKLESRKVPGSVYSYFGYGIALRESKLWEGLNLCQMAVEIGYYDADNFFNLARTYLLRNNRRQAISAIHKGLEVDPEHKGLLSLKNRMGIRRKPVLPFLNRSHPLNIQLGKLRHNLSKAGRKDRTAEKKAKEKKKKEEDIPNLFEL